MLSPRFGCNKLCVYILNILTSSSTIDTLYDSSAVIVSDIADILIIYEYTLYLYD